MKFGMTHDMRPKNWVLLNFRARSLYGMEYTLPQGVKTGELKLGNYFSTSDAPGSSIVQLRAWEARVYRQ